MTGTLETTEYDGAIEALTDAITQGWLSPRQLEPLRHAIVVSDYYGNALAIHDLQERQTKAAAWHMAIWAGIAPNEPVGGGEEAWESFIDQAEAVLHAAREVDPFSDLVPQPDPRIAPPAGRNRADVSALCAWVQTLPRPNVPPLPQLVQIWHSDAGEGGVS